MDGRGFVGADVLWEAERTGLIKCMSCGAKYSAKLRDCPQCGRPNPLNFSRRKR